jgi:hypothetical protein
MENINTAELLIRLGVGIVMVLFGLSQMKSPEKWLQYIPKFFQFIMPVRPTSFMRAHSLGNLGLGAWLMIGGGGTWSIWISILWWISILPSAFYHAYTTGLRDFAIIMALIALLVLNRS